jgi:hypothetical protein
MDTFEFSCSRGHVFRAMTNASELQCPALAWFDSFSGEMRICNGIATRIGPRVDAEVVCFNSERELCFT